MDDPGRIIVPDARFGKIGELNVCGVNFQPIAIATGQYRRLVCIDLQIPNLKVFPLDREDVAEQGTAELRLRAPLKPVKKVS